MLRVVLAVVVGVLCSVVAARAANDPGWDEQWNMRIVGAETAWATGTGKGITIAVVDSGVHLTQEDLSAKLLSGRDFVDPGTTPQDDNGHGTHVAGIAAAFANNGRGVVGVAPDAKILPVKVLDANGNGAADIDEGIRWAVDNGAHVINLSLGDLLEPLNGPPFTEAIRYAWSRGVICVIATGNEFVTSSSFADEPAVLVTATDRNDRKPAYATEVGGARWGMAAPGGAGGLSDESEDVFSTYWTRSNKPNEYQWLAGTSMAAPHVAGAAAVLRSLGLSPQQTVDRLLATAKDLGTAGRDDVYGHGRLDVAKAVAGLSAGGGGTSTGGGGGGTATTTTTAANGRRAGGSGSGTTNTTAGGSRAVPGSTTGSTAAGNAPDVTQGSVPVDETTTTDGSGGTDELGAAGDRPGTGSEDGDTTWPAGVLAVAALAAAGWAAARMRRLRV